LGINPVSGGRPPRDRRTKGVMAVRAGVFVHAVASILTLVDLFSLNTRNVEKVIMK